MSNDKMREEFELWARKMSMDLEYRNIPGVGQFYECPRTLLALEAWQGSREALVITLPNTECFGEYSEEAARIMRDSCADAIEEQGINFEVSE
ncbi:hypothetical protein ACKUFS_11485 [Pseudomonas cannabina]|uniref:hypothetical protein n=1 Tax=Pseudomonas syringae group TaxID=136849 RepID=UPI0006B9F6A7|nr:MULTISPECIES: hypothetical protein [Pseudomonas syringae group]KPB77946.1 Unknown protein sequence [Pseudomonas syringae pv. maculicola]QQN20110.1 hypothetical protein JGS08_15855 [Pseudomonas cannabina pv. alisalensis]